MGMARLRPAHRRAADSTVLRLHLNDDRLARLRVPAEERGVEDIARLDVAGSDSAFITADAVCYARYWVVDCVGIDALSVEGDAGVVRSDLDPVRAVL